MSSILTDQIPNSRFGFKGKKPLNFDLGPGSSLDFQSSLNNNPPFATYADAYLRTKKPTNLSLLRGATPTKYLDNPPK